MRQDRIKTVMQTICHLANTIGVDLFQRSIAKLRDKIPRHFARVGANSSYGSYLAAAVRFGPDPLQPALRVLLEAHGACFLLLRISAASCRHNRRWLSLPERNLRMHRRKPSAGVRLGEERKRLIVVGSRRVSLAIWARVPSLPTPGGQLPQAPPRFPLRRTHDALPCTRMDSNGRSCHSVPLTPCTG